MKRAFVFAVSLALIPIAAGASQSWSCNVDSWCGGLDGFWWAHLSAAARLVAVESMIEGSTFGYDWGTFDAVSSHLDAYQDQTATKSDQLFFARLRDPLNVVTFSKKPQVYVADVSHFYAEYPQKKPLKVVMVMYCLKDHPLYSCDVVGKSELLPWPTGP